MSNDLPEVFTDQDLGRKGLLNFKALKSKNLFPTILQVISSVGVIFSISLGLFNLHTQQKKDLPLVVPTAFEWTRNDNPAFTHRLRIELKNLGVRPAYSVNLVFFFMPLTFSGDTERQSLAKISGLEQFSTTLYAGIPTNAFRDLKFETPSAEQYLVMLSHYRASLDGELIRDMLFFRFRGVSADGKAGGIVTVSDTETQELRQRVFEKDKLPFEF